MYDTEWTKEYLEGRKEEMIGADGRTHNRDGKYRHKRSDSRKKIELMLPPKLIEQVKERTKDSNRTLNREFEHIITEFLKQDTKEENLDCLS